MKEEKLPNKLPKHPDREPLWHAKLEIEALQAMLSVPSSEAKQKSEKLPES